MANPIPQAGGAAAEDPVAAGAIRRYEERLVRDPASLAFAPLADAYRKAGRTREAINLCREGLGRFPHYTTARLILAKAHLDDGNPEPPAEISLALAGAWFRQGNVEEAEKENRNALKGRPDYGQAHNNLAVIYMMTGRFPEAREAVEKAEKSGFAVNPKLKEELERRAAAP